MRKDIKRLHELPQTQRLAGGRLCEQNPPVQRGLREKAQDRQGPRVVPGPLRGRGCDHRVHWKCPRESTRRPSLPPSLVSMACSNTPSSLSLCAVPFLLENTIYLSTFSRDRRTTVWQWRRRLGPASTSCARSPWVRQCGNLPLAGTDSLTGDPPPLLSLSLSVELGKE